MDMTFKLVATPLPVLAAVGEGDGWYTWAVPLGSTDASSVAHTMTAITLNDLSMALENVERLYKDDRLLDCLRLLRDVEQQIALIAPVSTETVSTETVSTSGASTSSQVTEKTIRERLDSPLFKRIKSEGERAEKLYETLMSDKEDNGDGAQTRKEDGWVLSYDGEDTKVWYKKNDCNDYDDDENAGGIHSIRLEGTINAPLLHVAALLYESDLYASLFWYVSSSQILPLLDDESDDEPNTGETVDCEGQGSSKNGLKRAVHITTFAPWPLHRRDVTLYAYAVDALQSHNCVIVLSSSISRVSANRIVSHIPNPQPKVVRAIIHNSGFVMTPISPNATKACFTYHIDPKLDFIPLSLINWASRTMCRWSLRVLESRARNLDSVSPLYKRRLQYRPVYKRIRNRLEQHWKEQGGKPQTSDRVEGSEDRASGTFDPDARPTIPPFFKLLRQK